MRTLEEIKKDVIDIIIKCPGITEGEIGKQLKLSVRFTKNLLNEMIRKGELCLIN